MHQQKKKIFNYYIKISTCVGIAFSISLNHMLDTQDIPGVHSYTHLDPTILHYIPGIPGRIYSMPGGGGGTQESTFIPNVTFILKRRRRGYKISERRDTQNTRAGIHTMAEHIEYEGIQDTRGGYRIRGMHMMRWGGGHDTRGGCTLHMIPWEIHGIQGRDT